METGNLKNEFKGVIDGAGTTDPSKTNTLKFAVSFGDKEVTEFEINGVTYRIGETEGVIYNEPDVIIEVPGAALYTIRGVADENAVIPRTIIWTNPGYVPTDEADEEWIQEFKIEHGNAYIKEVFDENGNVVDKAEYLGSWNGSEQDRGVGENHFGYVVIKPGYHVIFEFVPEYGYQLTDIRVNGQSIGCGDRVNEFEFEMPDANVHFDAEFTEKDNVVKTNSNKVSHGTIDLDEDTIDAGTVQLTVNDIDLDEDKIKEYEEAAKDYKIANYLDIDLYQIFYKGKDDSEDVWSNKIDALDKEVTIAIKLEDGVDGNDIVIVHNLHDGDEYEIIEIESYDKETNTITFKTSSFSGYAIASRTTEEKEITLTDENSKIVVEFLSEDHDTDDYEFNVMDLTNLSDEELEAFDIPKDVYEQAVKTIRENCEDLGTLIMVFQMEVRIPAEDRNEENGPFKIKIPYTEELKKYNTFKFAYINDEDFSVSEVIEFTVEGDYLVGILEHFSPYALVADYEEPEEDENTTEPTTEVDKEDTSISEDTNKETEAEEVKETKTEQSTTAKNSNPITGDNILIYVSIFLLSVFAITFEIVTNKNGRLSK
ncbi:MAG: hypothetical protein IKP28_00960 [Clostridia bacterium]|nr:hypothetical protein [Clostridia bacterium]